MWFQKCQRTHHAVQLAKSPGSSGLMPIPRACFVSLALEKKQRKKLKCSSPNTGNLRGAAVPKPVRRTKDEFVLVEFEN